MRGMRAHLAMLVVAVSVAAAHPGVAQPALSVSAGAGAYDLSGVGTSGVAAARVEWPLHRWVSVQAGSGFFWYGTQSDRTVAMLLPEAGLMARARGGIPLALIAGVGRSVGVKGSPDDDYTLHVAVALDIEDRAGWAVRPELRVRAVDPWAGTIADFTVGVRRTFGAF